MIDKISRNAYLHKSFRGVPLRNRPGGSADIVFNYGADFADTDVYRKET